MLSINPDLTLSDIKSLLQVSCDKIDMDAGAYDTNGHSIYYGYGRLNALKAVENTLATLQDDPEVHVEGLISFVKNGEQTFTNEIPAQSGESNDRIIGMSLKINPPIPDLSIEYQLKFNKIGGYSCRKGWRIHFIQ